MDKIKFNKEQEVVFDTTKNSSMNMLISASAGSGKTTTIKHCTTLIPKRADSIYLAFNNDIVKEMKEKMGRTNTIITTIHSFCWQQILRSTKFKAKLNKSKPYKHIESTLKNWNITDKKQKSYYSFIFSDLVNLVRFDLSEDCDRVVEIAEQYDILINEEEAEMALEVLVRMNMDYSEYDFPDMIYRVIEDDIRLPKFDFVFVDEAQDLSKCQQEILKKIKKPNGRLIAVGDPFQAIYGFAGADNKSFHNLSKLYPNTINLPLSVNYRCGKEIIKEAQRINPSITASPKAKNGLVRHDGQVSEIINSDWVLCRNVKPLVQLNMYLIHNGTKSYIKGQDIGIGLIRLLDKGSSSRVDKSLENYSNDISKEIVKMKKKGIKNPSSTEKIFNMNQKLEILKILAKGLIFTKDLISKIKSIFKESGEGVMLSTIHKSKGLENHRIFFLLPGLIPSKFATQDWQIEQEMNLYYVGVTRAKNELIYIEENEFEIVKNTIKKLIEK